MKNKLLITIHLLLVVLACTAWLWLDYRIVIAGALLHLAMLEVLKGCPLSLSQFKDQEQKDTRFYEWWMGKLGVKLTEANRRNMRVFMQYILPLLIIILALMTQLTVGIHPLIKL